MPQVTMPDGQIVDMPETLTPEMGARLRSLQDSQNPSVLSKIGSFAKNAVGGVVEPVAKMATGMVAKPISEIAGLAAMGADYMGNMGGDPAAFKQHVAESLTYTPTTEAGQSKYNPLNAVPEAIGAGVGFVANKAADTITGGNTADTWRGATGNVVREGVPQALGIIGLKSVPTKTAMQAATVAKQAELNVLKGQNSATDSVITQGRQAGFKFTPDELTKFGAGHPVGSAAEDVGALHVYHLNREANALDAKASIQNYRNTVKLAREDLTMPNGNPIPKNMAISDPTLDAFIKQHGTSYEAIKALPEPIPYTPKYLTEVESINNKLAAATQQYPALMKPMAGVQQLKNALVSGLDTTPRAAMEIVQKLREDASKVYGNTNSGVEALALAGVKKEAAGVIENLIGEHLQNTGRTGLLETFQKSRTQIAKAYELKNALDDGTVLNAQKIAKSDAPLTGNLKIIKDMALQHPALMQDPRGISTAGGGVAAGMVTGGLVALAGHPKIGAAIAARPAIAPTMLSNAYQNMFSKVPTYQAAGMLTGVGQNVIPVAGGMLAGSIPLEARR